MYTPRTHAAAIVERANRRLEDGVGTHIWEVKISDGVIKYFWDKVEADFYHRDTVEAGFAVHMQSIPVPKTAKDFCMFMEQQFADHRALILAAKKLAA